MSSHTRIRLVPLQVDVRSDRAGCLDLTRLLGPRARQTLMEAAQERRKLGLAGLCRWAPVVSKGKDTTLLACRIKGPALPAALRESGVRHVDVTLRFATQKAGDTLQETVEVRHRFRFQTTVQETDDTKTRMNTARSAEARLDEIVRPVINQQVNTLCAAAIARKIQQRLESRLQVRERTEQRRRTQMRTTERNSIQILSACRLRTFAASAPRSSY